MKIPMVIGVIENAHYTTKYDEEGNEYKLYSLTVSKQKYTAKLPKDIYLSEGMEVILGLSETSSKEIISGYCLKEGYEWGEHANYLKSRLSSTDKYEFVEGVIIEKRKSSTSSYDYSKSSMSSTRGVGYTIVLKDRDFHASAHFGEDVIVGMEIAVVLEKNDVVLLLNKTNDKMIGVAKPYYLLLLTMLIAFNATMFYLYQTNQTHLLNFNSTLIVINVFLILFTILSIYTYIVSNTAKKLLLSKI